MPLRRHNRRHSRVRRIWMEARSGIHSITRAIRVTSQTARSQQAASLSIRIMENGLLQLEIVVVNSTSSSFFIQRTYPLFLFLFIALL